MIKLNAGEHRKHKPRQQDSDSGICLGPDEQSLQDISPQSPCMSALHRRPATDACIIAGQCHRFHNSLSVITELLMKLFIHAQIY